MFVEIISCLFCVQKATGSSDRGSGSALADETVKRMEMCDDTVAFSSDGLGDASELQRGSESDSVMYTPDYSSDSLGQDHVIRQHPDSSRSDQDRPSTVRRSRSRSSSRCAFLFFSAVCSVHCWLDDVKDVWSAGVLLRLSGAGWMT